MTYLNERTEELDTEIIKNFPTDCDVQRWTTKQHGVCRVQYDQNHGGYLLHDEQGNKVTIDNSFDVQLIHVNNSVAPTNVSSYGSYTGSSYLYVDKLIVLTTKNTALERVLKAFENVPNVQFRGTVTDTELVLRNEMKINIGKDKNYPPEYKAYLFNYQFLNVTPEIIDES